MPVFNKKLLGLDIGSSAIKWILYSSRNGTLYNWGISEIPRGLVQDGNVIDHNGIAQKIGEILRSSGEKPSGVMVSLSCPEMIIRTVMLPKLVPRELESVVRFEVEQMLPQGAGEYITDYKILGEALQEGAVQLKVLIAAVPYEIVKEYLQVFKRLSLKLRGADFHGNCISRTVNLINNGSRGARQLVVDAGTSTAAITIVENGAPVFARVIHISTNEQLLKDIYRSVEFFKSRNGGSIDSLIMAGGSSHLKDLGSCLSSGLGLKRVSISDKVPPFFKEGFPSEQAEAFANVLGLALGGSKGSYKDINLLPEEQRDTLAKRRTKVAKAAAAVLACAAAAGALTLPIFYIDGLRSRSTGICNEVARRETIMEYREIREELHKVLESRKNVIGMLKSQGRKWSSTFERISRAASDTVLIETVNYSHPNVLKVLGKAADYETVARFAEKLKQTEDIVSAEPVSIAASGEGTFDFEIRCLLRGEAGED